MTKPLLRSPVRWYGGKGQFVYRLLPLLPRPEQYRQYVEVFGGGASLLFGKPPSPIEVYNDLDGGLVNFFRVLQREETFARFERIVALTPVSQEAFTDARDEWRDFEDPIEAAAAFFIRARQNFSGSMTASAWGRSVFESHRHMVSSCSRWLTAVEHLPEIAARLLRVQIEQRDFREILCGTVRSSCYAREDTLFYCDPPYPAPTRGTSHTSYYKHEMTEADHADLVEILLQIRGQAIVSGYDSPLYAPLEDAGWRRLEWETVAHSVVMPNGGGKRADYPRTEVVWLSPGIPATQPRLQMGEE